MVDERVNHEERKRVGDRIRKLLKEKDQTIAQMSRFSGIPRTSINNVIYGVAPMRADDAIKFARFLHTSVEHLYGMDEVPPATKIRQAGKTNLSGEELIKIALAVREINKSMED